MRKNIQIALLLAAVSLVLAASFSSAAAAPAAQAPAERATGEALERIEPPPVGEQIRVAFVLSRGATMIDFTGPWEVFQDVHIHGRGTSHAEAMPFQLYTVAASLEPVQATGGMRIVPDYTFDTAPQPHVIVVPAQSGSDELRDWLRTAGKGADVTMSVCTGAFQLAKAGLLDGLQATTHHQYLDMFEEQFSETVSLQRGVRWVDNGEIATAAGLTSGIDLALHVVARYFGPDVAEWTAKYMEHASDDWRS